MRTLLIVCVAIGLLCSTCCLGPLILFTFVAPEIAVDSRAHDAETVTDEVDEFEEQSREEMKKVIPGISPSRIVDELKLDGFRVTENNKRGTIARSWSLSKTDSTGNEFLVQLMGPLDDDQKVSYISISVIINPANPRHDRVREWFNTRSFISRQELKDVFENHWNDKFLGEVGGLDIQWLGNNEYAKSLNLSAGASPEPAVEETVPESDSFRTWTSNDGKFSVEAKFRFMTGQKVKLEKRNGEVIEVDLSRLSDESIEYIEAKRVK